MELVVVPLQDVGNFILRLVNIDTKREQLIYWTHIGSSARML
jgi:hypothetical protein